MRNFLKILSCIALVGGVAEIILSILITGGFDLIYIGIILAIVGFIGCLLTYKKTGDFIWDLIEVALYFIFELIP